MIALILFLSGIALFISRHPWFGGLCWLFALAAFLFGDVL
jgi:hypothetical protein